MTERILNSSSRTALEYLNQLRDTFPQFLRGRWFSRPSVTEIAEYCRLLASARANLWIEIEHQFPETQCGAWTAFHNRVEEIKAEAVKP